MTRSCSKVYKQGSANGGLQMGRSAMGIQMTRSAVGIQMEYCGGFTVGNIAEGIQLLWSHS